MGLINESRGLIDESANGQRRFGPGHFDLIVIDESHRSVYQRYGAIFDYFDSLLVGLTATPVDEIDRNTYRLFHLEPGVPTDVYGIDEAVRDGYLVPPVAVSVPLRFQREGIDYNHLSDEEKATWDDLEWTEDGEVPGRVEAEAVNKWLFNIDTVDKVLEQLMKRGQKVAAGDRLGKTIIFAKNQAHATFIEDRFNANYPHYAGAFARTITFQTEYAQSLIDNFSNPDKAPHLAISVDMLDTGIDVPEVLNLVFFKLIRSKTRFWQMLGRGTRLCTPLSKKFFYIFDYCQNLEFFRQNPNSTDGAAPESLSKRLFVGRLELIQELDRRDQTEPETELRKSTVHALRLEVANMNLDNFIVRPKRRYVERYTEPAAWQTLETEHHAELAEHLAGLPTAIEDPDIDARQFDYLMLRLQLTLLRAEPAYTGLRDKVRDIAQLLSEKESIPMVREQMALILEVLTDTFWEDVTTPILDNARRRLRALVKLIEKAKRKPVFTDFEDQMGEETEIAFPRLAAPAEFERFREKARAFLRKHLDNPAVRRVRENQPLTTADLAELERLLLQAAIGTAENIRQAREASAGFGLFVRSLAGLDRQAAAQAFDQFIQGRRLTANQLQFVELVIACLTEQGTVDPALLYESPFTDFSAKGIEGLFPSPDVTEIVGILADIRQKALTATAVAG
jgi:type I restriction enzyme R subunit